MPTVFSNLNFSQVNRLFPFYFAINTALEIHEHGRSLEKIVAFDASKSFFQSFRMMRPQLKHHSFEELLTLQNQLIVLQSVQNAAIKIRGQFEFIEDKQMLLFVGSPWFNDIIELQAAKLSLFDFAFFDPLADLLQVVKNQQIANDDIKLLLNKIKQQKQTLEITTKELQDNQTRLQLLSTIAEQTINGVVITDREGKIEWINDSFAHITGYMSEEVIGKTPGEVLQGAETDPKTVAYLRQQIREGKPFNCEILNYRKNGDKYWIKVVGNPILDTKGDVIGFFALEENITKRIHTEQALRDAKEKSDAIAHSKNIFLTNMSHEMRTPLNAIIGMGQQLDKTPLSEQQHFFLDTMQTAAEHLLVIINDILDISRIEAGKLNLEAIDFNLRALINRCINVLSPKAEEKGLLFKAYIDNDVAPYLVGDPHRINQILLNLLGNALKFTEQGSVRLLVSCLHQKDAVQTLRFVVEDTGIGIENEFISELFAEFSQEDTSIVRKYGGTGLGLNITKKLVELMNGSIGVSSQKNVGTAFSIELQLPIGNSANIKQAENIVINPEILTDKVILLVEDNEMNRILARTILHNYEVQLLEVDNGEKAIKLLEKQPVDLILMDIQMPIMDGIAATQYIRNVLQHDTPILALTANALKGEREKCITAGMNAYISKPFREKELVALICTLLEKNTVENTPPLSIADTDERLYHFDYLNEISDNNTAFLIEMVNIFIAEAERVKDKMPTLLKEKNFNEIRAMAHKVKSNLSMLAIEEATNLAHNIENLENDDSETMETLVHAFLIQINLVLKQIRKAEF